MSTRFRRRSKRQNIARARAKKLALAQLPLPTFIEGMADVMDWSGALMPSMRDLYGDFLPEELDSAAIAEDWRAVGQDLYEVLNDRERRKSLAPSSE
jgi:hypothetical protein